VLCCGGLTVLFSTECDLVIMEHVLRNKRDMELELMLKSGPDEAVSSDRERELHEEL
jgi:hypothetical protein